MPDPRPWKYDPVAFGYFAQLEAHLRRNTLGEATSALRLIEDLLVRSRAAAEKSKNGDNSDATIIKRISWCCYLACDEMLFSLNLIKEQQPLEGRKNVGVKQLAVMNDAIKHLEQAVHVDCAEYKMGDLKQQMGSGQSWGDTLKKRLREIAAIRRMLTWAKKYCEQEDKEYAMAVGEELLLFCAAHGETRDKLVERAEQLVEVHA